MAEYLLRQGKIQSHEENGPINGMEADNVFADEMQISRPQFMKLMTALSVTLEIGRASCRERVYREV